MTIPRPSLDDSPYQQELKLEWVKAERGLVEIRLPWQDRFLRAPGSDWYHGGVIAALIDIAGDYALWMEVGGGLPTIDLRVDWLRPARKGALLARGRTVRAGKTVCCADIEVFDEQGVLVAVGRGTYATPKPTNA